MLVQKYMCQLSIWQADKWLMNPCTDCKMYKTEICVPVLVSLIVCAMGSWLQAKYQKVVISERDQPVAASMEALLEATRLHQVVLASCKVYAL